jgi:spore coat protein A, manganese oxidase
MTSIQISRKQFLGIGAGAAAGVALAGSGMAAFLSKEAQAVTTAVRLTPFMDPLPIPPVLTPASQNPLAYRLTIDQTSYQFHKALSSVPVWGYNTVPPNQQKPSGYLGPTIEARKGTATTVEYANKLPTKHLLNVDPTITQMRGKPVNSRMLTHLHGGHISSTADGNPYVGSTNLSGQVVPDFPSGQTQKVKYQNDQEAAHLWYHDHALGITRLNVMAGLAGVYLLRDSVDNGAGGNFGTLSGGTLPSGVYEVPLVIQDRAFAKDGRIKYPAQWTPEFFGDVVIVNGKVWPFKEVEARKYRMRILNGSNSRFYNLQLTDGKGNATGATMKQIGTDGGFLEKPVDIPTLLIAPGERADVIFDFNGENGNRVYLEDMPLPQNSPTVSPATPLARRDFMEFRVGPATDEVMLPPQLRGSAFSVPEVSGATKRYLTLEEVLAGGVPQAVLLNGMHFADPVTERPSLNTTEDWWLVNLSADTHPIHLHLVQFEIVERRVLDVPGYQQALTAARNAAGGPFVVDQATNQATLVTPNNPEQYFGANLLVDDNEKGPKDTVRANPMQATHIRAHFDIADKYVWHCHILEHEDNDMMRPYEVVV